MLPRMPLAPPWSARFFQSSVHISSSWYHLSEALFFSKSMVDQAISENLTSSTEFRKGPLQFPLVTYCNAFYAVTEASLLDTSQCRSPWQACLQCHTFCLFSIGYCAPPDRASCETQCCGENNDRRSNVVPWTLNNKNTTYLDPHTLNRISFLPTHAIAQQQGRKTWSAILCY